MNFTKITIILSFMFLGTNVYSQDMDVRNKISYKSEVGTNDINAIKLPEKKKNKKKVSDKKIIEADLSKKSIRFRKVRTRAGKCSKPSKEKKPCGTK